MTRTPSNDRVEKLAAPLTEWRKLPAQSNIMLVDAGAFRGLDSENADLRAQLAAMDRTLRATAGEEYAHCTDAVGAVQEYVKDLEAERDSLQTQLDDNSSLGIHSCHDNCQRVECVLRRDRDRYRAACEEMRFERELAELRASGSEADKKRLDWLGSASQNQWIGLGLVRPIRAAIDAAMQQQEAKQ